MLVAYHVLQLTDVPTDMAEDIPHVMDEGPIEERRVLLWAPQGEDIQGFI